MTGTTETSVIAGSGISAAVTVEKNEAGEITNAQAEVTKSGAAKAGGVQATIFAKVVSQITDAAGVADVDISVSVVNKKGETEYTVRANTEDLTAGNKLKVFALDPETGNYVLVNDKTYTATKSGNVKLTLPAGTTYQLMDTEDAAVVEKAILATVKVKQSSATVQTGKTTTIRMSSKLDMDNVDKITYSSSKKSVASVSKTGKITAKDAGTVTIKAKVTLKNGAIKTVKMKVTVE